MAYDEGLAAQIRARVAAEPGVTEKRMFGGLAFLINGHMAAAASSRGAMLLRVDPAETDALVTEPHAERQVMRGRALDGWLHIDTAALDDATLERWIARGVAYARALPPK
jgi:TfoX/Sxy family transcriptional regulator of competence genes